MKIYQKICFKTYFRTLKSYKRPTVVKNIFFSLFTSLQSNNDPFLLRSSSVDCEQSSGPIQISSVPGKSWPLLPYFKLYFIAFSCHFGSLMEAFAKSRASCLARVLGMDLHQPTLFYTRVAPTSQLKICFKFKKMQLMDCTF